jgi:hypothetical protein
MKRNKTDSIQAVLLVAWRQMMILALGRHYQTCEVRTHGSRTWATTDCGCCQSIRYVELTVTWQRHTCQPLESIDNIYVFLAGGRTALNKLLAPSSTDLIK